MYELLLGSSWKALRMVKYLARYLTGGPISDRRLVRHHEGRITFRARTGTVHGGSRETEEVTLDGAEFVRRWCLHILPKGFTKTRRYGGYSNRHCERYLRDCREGLDADSLSSARPAPETPDAAVDSSEALPPIGDAASSSRSCPHCGQPMIATAAQDRPGWDRVLRSPARPLWYDDS